MEHRIIEKLLRESSTLKVRKPQVLSLFYENLPLRAGESFPYFRRRLVEEVPSLPPHTLNAHRGFGFRNKRLSLKEFPLQGTL